MRLIRIVQENFDDYWPAIDPLLSDACKRSSGKFSVQSSLELLLAGKWQFWVGIDEKTKVKVFGTTELLEFPTGLKVLSIIMVTGTDMKSWTHLIDEVAGWGKEQGCSMVQSWSRPGWQRILKTWKLTHVLLERGL